MTLVDIRDGAIALSDLDELEHVIQPDSQLAEITDEMLARPVLAVNFPVFSDGRAYSIARRLRGEFGYKGRLWAVGDVLVDQVPLMARVGFDGFVFRDAPDLTVLERALNRYGSVYQSGADNRRPIWELRRPRRVA